MGHSEPGAASGWPGVPDHAPLPPQCHAVLGSPTLHPSCPEGTGSRQAFGPFGSSLPGSVGGFQRPQASYLLTLLLLLSCMFFAKTSKCLLCRLRFFPLRSCRQMAFPVHTPARFHPETLWQPVSPLDSDMHQPLLLRGRFLGPRSLWSQGAWAWISALTFVSRWPWQDCMGSAFPSTKQDYTAYH